MTSITTLPQFYSRLMALGYLTEGEIQSTSDGFRAVTPSLADILARKGVTTFPGDDGRALECRLFFDDWHLYAVPGRKGDVYGLFKLREQEYDAQLGLEADGDTPGVTISFISFHAACLERCLLDPTDENRCALAQEINRVVAYPRQLHHPDLKAYFIRSEAEAPYLIARLYVQHAASFARDGVLPVPKHYRTIYREFLSSGKGIRIPRFLEKNNMAAGYTVCDHENIYIQDKAALSGFEKLAILATHTGNVSIHSFAADVRYHALFLTRFARIPLPFTGSSAYASAVRADLSIQDREFQGPQPYYRLNSLLVRQQLAHHGTQQF